MPNDLDPVKIYRKTILVFIIVTDAHPRDDDSWPWPCHDLDPKPKPNDNPNPCSVNNNNNNRSRPSYGRVIKCIRCTYKGSSYVTKPTHLKDQRSHSWPWPCHDLDPVVTLTLNRNRMLTLTHAQSTTTTTGHDPGSSSASNALKRGQIIWHRCHITIYYWCFNFCVLSYFFRICDIDEELILSYICIAMTYNVCESYGYTCPWMERGTVQVCMPCAVCNS